MISRRLEGIEDIKTYVTKIPDDNKDIKDVRLPLRSRRCTIIRRCNISRRYTRSNITKRYGR